MTGGDVDRLREIYLASLRDARSGADDPHPEAERIWDAVSGVLPPSERREIVDRVATNPAWAEAWLLATEIWSATAREIRPRGFWEKYRYLAAAASVVLLVGAGIVAREVLRPGPIYRDPGEKTIESLVPEDRALPREDVVLQWTAPVPDARYQVTITSDALEVVASARDLEEPRYRVPPESLSEIPSGHKLFWQVTARMRDGTERRSSTFVVTIE